MDISGILLKKGEIIEENGYSKRTFAITIEGTYPKTVAFELGKKNLDAISNLKTGERIKVSFDASSREWNGKFYTTLYAWKIEKENPTTQVQSGETTEQEPEVDYNNLPF